jgi:hypothetical protein
VGEVPDGHAAVELPDRVTVLTCLGCGAMGRQERCGGNCTEHRLVLVSAADYDAQIAAAQAARDRAARLAPVVRGLAEADAGPPDPRAALLKLREEARGALREAGRAAGSSPPETVTGWWCHRCGNVDLPQPCIGVCVWRPQEWVNVSLLERAARDLGAARALDRFLARVVAVTPAAGQWERNWEALQVQARAALRQCS